MKPKHRETTDDEKETDGMKWLYCECRKVALFILPWWQPVYYLYAGFLSTSFKILGHSYRIIFRFLYVLLVRRARAQLLKRNYLLSNRRKKRILARSIIYPFATFLFILGSLKSGQLLTNFRTYHQVVEIKFGISATKRERSACAIWHTRRRRNTWRGRL